MANGLVESSIKELHSKYLDVKGNSVRLTEQDGILTATILDDGWFYHADLRGSGIRFHVQSGGTHARTVSAPIASDNIKLRLCVALDCGAMLLAAKTPETGFAS
jgi:hypothetical protein